jgi:hypothetical protein
MRILVMGKFMVILIRWLFRRGRLPEMAHEVFKGGFEAFEVFEVFDVRTLFLEDINSQID